MRLKNPIINPSEHIPDTEVHVMPDGRAYIYGSYDEKDCKWGSDKYKVYSTKDMEDIIDHGVSLHLSQLNNPNARLLYAPDCIYNNGKYYLYICCEDDTEWVAEASKPWGPFTKCTKIEGIKGIDPAVFIDDGIVYYFWGQFSLNGCILNNDMCTIKENSIVNEIITQEKHYFHEGISMRKRNGIYYLTFSDVSRGKKTEYGGVPTCIGYATSKNPFGPFTYRGVIVDSAACDPKSWNNHGSIEEIEGQWYVFYHRSSRNSEANRRCCCEKIYFDEEGLIKEVPMTSSGANDYLNACDVVFDGALACGFDKCYNGLNGKHESVFVLAEDASAVYRWIKFDDEKNAEMHACGVGVVQLIFKHEKEEIVLTEVNFDGKHNVISASLNEISGMGELILKFKAIEGFCFDRLIFYK